MKNEVQKAAADCQHTLDELKTLLEGKKSAPVSEDQMQDGLEALKDLFGFDVAPKRPADNY